MFRKVLTICRHIRVCFLLGGRFECAQLTNITHSSVSDKKLPVSTVANSAICDLLCSGFRAICETPPKPLINRRVCIFEPFRPLLITINIICQLLVLQKLRSRATRSSSESTELREGSSSQLTLRHGGRKCPELYQACFRAAD